MTYEPQWGSDVFAMFQSLVEGREIPRELLVKNIPPEKHFDLDFIVSELDWEANVDPYFKEHHYLEPIPAAKTENEGYIDRWIVYGEIGGEQLFSAKELTLEPGVKCTVRDNGAYGLTVVQGRGKMNNLVLDAPNMIRFVEMTDDEVFCTEAAARAGVKFENISAVENLVLLRYFGPGVNPEAPRLSGGEK